MSWTEALPLSELSAGHTTVFKSGEHQIAVVHTRDGEVFAIDNRCPHEGYPLAQGTVAGCVLTCNWHNYKFDLRDGACVMGEEAVRSYPTRIQDDIIVIDLSPPDPEEQRAKLWASMDEGMRDHQMGRVARDVVRLLSLDVQPAEIAVYGARWDALYAEYGSSHALPVAADILHWMDAYPGPQAAIPLVQALDIAARTHIRRPLRARPEPRDPGADPVAAGVRFCAAVEAEDADLAEGMVRGAIAKGWAKAELTPWLYRSVSAHFLDFGHQLIYLTKLIELLDQVGWEHADPVLSSFVFGVVNGTREDLLPEWSSLNKHLDSLDGELSALFTASSAAADPDWNGHQALIDVVLDGRRMDAFTTLTEALRHRAPLTTIVDALSEAAGQRMLRFDPELDPDPSTQDSWLSVTHIQTYMAALRHAVANHPSPDVLRLAFFGVMFCHKGRGLDAEEPQVPDQPWPAHEGVEPLLNAMASKRRLEALGRTEAWLHSNEDLSTLRTALMSLAVQDAVTRPIVVAHIIKNTIVAFEEHEATGSPTPVLALIALLSSPVKERRVHRVTREAIAFVTEGKVPRSIM